MGNIACAAAAGIACVTAFVLLFINAAAGIIGDGPVNALYVGVITIGFAGALIARFEPRGMMRALFAAAAAQMLVPVVALAMWTAGWEGLLTDPHSPHPPFHPGIGPVFALNAVFAAAWIASAMLFRAAARQRGVANQKTSGPSGSNVVSTESGGSVRGVGKAGSNRTKTPVL